MISVKAFNAFSASFFVNSVLSAIAATNSVLFMIFPPRNDGIVCIFAIDLVINLYILFVKEKSEF